MNEVTQRGIDPNRPYPPDPYSSLPKMGTFTLICPDFQQGQPLPDSASADGGSVSPELSWSDFPPETKSFAVTCFDPDAPRPGGFWHWLVLNLPKTLTSLPQGAGTPSPGMRISELGAYTAKNDAGYACYAGARPPSGDHEHRYIFAVHALDSATLVPDPNATCAEIFETEILPHTLARATLTGSYQR